MRNECFKNQPMFIFKKPKKKFLENLWDFLRRQTPSKWGGKKSSLTTAALTTSRNGKILILNKNEALNPKAEN